MVKLKNILLFLLTVFCITVLFSCAEKNTGLSRDTEEPGTFKGLSLKKEKQIVDDYYNNYYFILNPIGEDWPFIPPFLAYENFKVAVYLGTYNGYTAVMMNPGSFGGNSPDYRTIAGTLFTFRSYNEDIYLWKDGESFTELGQAYDKGLVKADDVKDMSDLYYSYRFPNAPPGYFVEQRPDEETEQEILFDYYGDSEPYSGIFYLGTYKGYIALMMLPNGNDLALMYSFKVAGKEYMIQDGKKFEFWKRGEGFIEIGQAYNLGIVSEDEAKNIILVKSRYIDDERWEE